MVSSTTYLMCDIRRNMAIARYLVIAVLFVSFSLIAGAEEKLRMTNHCLHVCEFQYTTCQEIANNQVDLYKCICSYFKCKSILCSVFPTKSSHRLSTRKIQRAKRKFGE